MDWERLFKKDSIDVLFAEHVLEHISDEGLNSAFQCAYQYLKKGGVFRIAVPDGYRNDAPYVMDVKPPSDGHLQYFTVDSLPTLLKRAGFNVSPKEYFDSTGKFHTSDWDDEFGIVRRSKRYDSQQKYRIGDLFYTSLIVDAIKPVVN
jgi:predicted SAM-dependent methyltransferase